MLSYAPDWISIQGDKKGEEEDSRRSRPSANINGSGSVPE
jgi:hypothetical protein